MYIEGHIEYIRYIKNGTMYSVNLSNPALDNSIFVSLASVKIIVINFPILAQNIYATVMFNS